MLLCGDLIIPSLFPFFILSTLTVSLGFSSLLGRLLEPMMQPLFHQNGTGASALVLGFIGGYPVGAKTVCSLYQERLCTREQAQCLLAFCNNSGPAFIIGGAGIAIFQSARAGFVLMAIQILSALLVGMLFRPKKKERAFGHSSPRTRSGEERGKVCYRIRWTIRHRHAEHLRLCDFVQRNDSAVGQLWRSGLL